MKIGIFTDTHYCKADILCETRMPSLSLRKICEAMEAFRREGVDICICLGDLTDHADGDAREDVISCFREAMELIRSYEIPFYLVPGNHDYLMMSGEELEAFGVRIPPYSVTSHGRKLIFLDANYRESGKRFDTCGVEWTDSNLPLSQCDFLKRELLGFERRAIVLIHENLDPLVEPRHVVKNAKAVREIIKNKAVAVLQGHYHPGAEHFIDGIPYVTLSAMCEGEGNSYRIFEF